MYGELERRGAAVAYFRVIVRLLPEKLRKVAVELNRM
jgi:hypothetical protein